MRILRKLYWDNERWRMLVSLSVGIGVAMFVTPEPPEALDGDFLEWFLASVLIGAWVSAAFSLVTVMVKPIEKKGQPPFGGEDTGGGA